MFGWKINPAPEAKAWDCLFPGPPRVHCSQDHVATITMDRPPLHAMSQRLVEGMAAAFDSFDNLPTSG